MTDAAKAEAGGDITTLIGEGTEFEGKLSFRGTIRIDGTVKGQILSEDVLIIGPDARVEAEIDVGQVIIQGQVIGNIHASRSIELFAPGSVLGDMTTPSLLIEKGAVFEGRSLMKKPPAGPDKSGKKLAKPS
jgi:cytoskeletal protein CcmA (bactofilin family)